jgi:hypothetical protein
VWERKVTEDDRNMTVMMMMMIIIIIIIIIIQSVSFVADLNAAAVTECRSGRRLSVQQILLLC